MKVKVISSLEFCLPFKSHNISQELKLFKCFLFFSNDQIKSIISYCIYSRKMVRWYSSLSAVGAQSVSPMKLPLISLKNNRGSSRRPRESIRVPTRTVIAVFSFFAFGSTGITAFVLNVRHASAVTALVEQEREDVDQLVKDKDIAKNRRFASDEDTCYYQENSEWIKQRLDIT